jgi:hypothetical protein
VHHRLVIYRILTDTGAYRLEPDAPEDDDEAWIWTPSSTDLGGAGRRRPRVDWQDLAIPEITNRRARFYFTEDGWRRYGRTVYEKALQAGHQVKVIRRKNPHRSQVVYRDRWQVAILPLKAR